jgi:nicotinamidase-related amidase
METNVSSTAYTNENTGLLIVDPYNDFLSDGGKLWPHAKETAEAVGLLPNMRRVLAATRRSGIRTIIVPHRRAKLGDYMAWQHLSLSQQLALRSPAFVRGTWGGEFHPDFTPMEGELVAHEHWAASGFANTDLDLLLKQHGLSQIILIGMRVNTCIDTTARFGQELGYHVTLIKDAIAGFSEDEMQATFEVNAPTYAHAILSTAELIHALPCAADA